MSNQPPFELRIFVAGGDPDVLRLVIRSNWIGKAWRFHEPVPRIFQSRRDCFPKPRVARCALPWVTPKSFSQPQRGCVMRIDQDGRNPVGVDANGDRLPKVAAQPWAGGRCPFGAKRSSRRRSVGVNLARRLNAGKEAGQNQSRKGRLKRQLCLRHLSYQRDCPGAESAGLAPSLRDAVATGVRHEKTVYANRARHRVRRRHRDGHCAGAGFGRRVAGDRDRSRRCYRSGDVQAKSRAWPELA